MSAIWVMESYVSNLSNGVICRNLSNGVICRNFSTELLNMTSKNMFACCNFFHTLRVHARTPPLSLSLSLSLPRARNSFVPTTAFAYLWGKLSSINANKLATEHLEERSDTRSDFSKLSYPHVIHYQFLPQSSFSYHCVLSVCCEERHFWRNHCTSQNDKTWPSDFSSICAKEKTPLCESAAEVFLHPEMKV